MVDRAAAQSPWTNRPRFGHFELWLALAIALHASSALSARAILFPTDLRELTASLWQTQHALLGPTMDIAVDQVAPPAPPAPPPPEPAPDPTPAQAPAPQVQAPKAQAPAPPPTEAPPPEPLVNRAERAVAAAADAVAEAAKVLARDDDDPGAVAIASGNSDTVNSGYVAGAGEGTRSTWNPGAGVRGKSGGVGKSIDPNAQLGPDRSRGARVIGTLTDGDFPEEAEMAGIPWAIAVVRVKVKPDGTAEWVKVLSDPGYGFGEAARQAALKTRFQPALDRSGNPIAGEIAPVNVRFIRH